MENGDYIMFPSKYGRFFHLFPTKYPQRSHLRVSLVLRGLMSHVSLIGSFLSFHCCRNPPFLCKCLLQTLEVNIDRKSMTERYLLSVLPRQPQSVERKIIFAPVPVSDFLVWEDERLTYSHLDCISLVFLFFSFFFFFIRFL
jgi:hypothetical protein